jgi:uncharacterized membrane-anchored protein YhcB (DUF1043 family)
LLFFGTSATLFLTRRDLKRESVKYKQLLDDAKEGFDQQTANLTKMIEHQDKAVAKLENSNANLSGDLSKEKRSVLVQTQRADKAESERKTAQENATAHLNPQGARREHSTAQK